MDRKLSARDSKRQERQENLLVIPVFYCPPFPLVSFAGLV